jgi:predicted lipoprotein with Yx(FWY)xxD motif
MRMTRSRLSILAVALCALLAAGCGDDETSDTNANTQSATVTDDGAPAANAGMRPKPKGAIVKVVASDYGRVIADRKGEAFYLFDRESTARSECYGDCATAWPPMLTDGRPRAGRGAEQKLLGTARRRDGKLQVTYAGHPLYYYKDDSPGNILCQNVDEFGGLWLVVKPDGEPVT